MRKIYLGFVAETELDGRTILPEYFFQTRAFTTLERAKRTVAESEDRERVKAMKITRSGLKNGNRAKTPK